MTGWPDGRTIRPALHFFKAGFLGTLKKYCAKSLLNVKVQTIFYEVYFSSVLYFGYCDETRNNWKD